MAETETPPGEFDTSEAVNVTRTYEEAQEAGYLGATWDDGDYTVAGVTGEKQGKTTPPKPPPQVHRDEPKPKADK